MPSLLPGFEYDIFISYRQKDNLPTQGYGRQVAGWVTDFVQALQNELQSTFKEEISIYFDSNPHDGLLETHDVDGSLKEKIKCLVFIPIVSQTFCDPKSFAWQKEFLAFVDIAKNDQYGLDIKLSNSNVAKRVLPVRIHEIDDTDKKLFEDSIGGVMRPVDFIYKEPGVNRPLSQDDSDVKNLNQTTYKNQVNKVANAVKEIITAIQRGPEKIGVHELSSVPNSADQSSSNNKPKVIVGMVILMLALALYFIVNNWPTSGAGTTSETSIAILPFINNTGKVDMDFYGMGVASEIRTQLALAKQFDFISSMQATMAFKNSVENPESIGQKLGVTHIITGMYQGVENDLRGVVELVEASSGKIVWSLPFNTKATDFDNLQASIANDVITQFKGKEMQNSSSTTNLQAFAEVIRGDEIRFSTINPYEQLPAQAYYKRAIQLDSSYLKAWVRLTQLYTYFHFVFPQDTTVKATQTADLIKYITKHFDDDWETKEIKGLYTYQGLKEYEKAKTLLHEVLEKNPDAEIANDYLSAIYKRQLNTKMALKYRLKYLQINTRDISSWQELGVILRNNGDYGLAVQAFRNDGTEDGLGEYEVQYDRDQLDVLSEKARTGNQKRYPCDQYLLDRNFTGLISHLRNLKPDSTLTQAAIDSYKLRTYYHLKQRDSIRFYAKKLEQPKPKYKSNQSVFVLPDSEVLAASLLAGKSKLSDFYDTESKQFNQDLMLQAYMMVREIEIAIFLENFEEATDLLTFLNQKYPAFGYYSWLNRPDYDRIKVEYPAFQEAINNLKLPPKTSDLGGLKL